MKLSVSGRGGPFIPVSPVPGKKLPEGRDLPEGQKISAGIPGGKSPALPRVPEQIPGLPPPSFPDSPELSGLAETALRNLAQALGLPRDSLSSSLLSFIRYFSLPLEPEMLSRLRAEAASPRFPGRTLAAAAAADKGVRLSAEALERYGAAINGEERREGTFSGGGEGQTGWGPGDSRKEKPPPADPDKLRKKIAAVEADQPLLRLLNGIPGKNGRRWVVLPFSFLSEGVEFRVSVRILLGHRGVFTDTVERLGVDIVAGSGGRHWLFVLDRTQKAGKGGAPAGFRAEITLNPPLSRSVFLERELHALLEPFAAAITLFQGQFTPLRDSRNDALPSVNEEV